MDQYLTIEEILAADDTVQEDHDCPEWGGKIRIRSLTASEASEVLRLSSTTKGKVTQVDSTKAVFHSIRLGTVEPHIDGNLLEALMKKSAKRIFEVSKRIQELSGFSLEDEESLEKN